MAATERVSVSASGKIVGFLTGLRRGSRAHGVAYPVAVARALSLYARGAFSRKEILGYALYVPAVRDALPVLISKEASLARLAAINPPTYHDRTESKDVFHRVCVDHGLPVPDTYGWTRGGAAFDDRGRPLDGGAWEAHLAATLPEDFIVKDLAGAYGSGFRTLRREGERIVGDAQAADVPSLAARLRDHDLIVQRRLFDDPRLAVLSGRRGLQTARINTLLHEDGDVEILFWMIKVLAGKGALDNFSMGTTGNLIAVGDRREGGVLRSAVTRHPSGSGLARLDRHPVTGVPFDGFRLPWWAEAVDLVKRAQRVFPELPTLGWDVALTADGPRLIEANARWDPPTYAPQLLAPEHWQAIFAEGRRPGRHEPADTSH